MKPHQVTYFISETLKVEIVYCRDIEISYSEHNHISDYVIGIVLDGKIQLTQSNEHKIVGKEDFFIIPPYQPHTIKAAYGEYTLITVCIGADFVREYHLESVTPIFKDLVDFLLIKKLITSKHLAVFSRAVEMLFLSGNIKQEPMTEEVLFARNYLEHMPEKIISLEQLSKSVFISKFHFIRRFKYGVGLTPHRFQMQNRIRKAQHLLINNRNIAEVALATGFYDQSHFIKCFKRMIGVTPSEYLLSIVRLPI